MKQNIRNFIKYKDLLKELIIKEIKMKYKNSILGILWSMLDPLLTMIILTIVFGSVFKKDIPNFPVYVLVGRITYSFFSESTKSAMESILSNRQLIKKIYVPKYFFPLSKVCATFITFIISFIPLLMMMALTGVRFHKVNVLIVFPLLYLLVITLGIGLLLCTIRVFFGDVKHLYGALLLMIMYMTPIFYPANIIPSKFVAVIRLNPLFTIVNMLRDIMMYNTVPTLESHLLCVGLSIVYLGIGLIGFYKAQDKFILHI